MPILDANSLEFFSRSADQTRRIGMRLGALLERGDLVALAGDIGAGKTTLVQGIAAGWGSMDAVSSPTYVLVNIYRRTDDQRLAHLDAYRLSGEAEAELLDLDQLLLDGPMIVEWAPRIGSILPEERLTIQMEYVEEEHRQMQAAATGERYEDLLEHMRETVFGGG
jgi:tRNA threonylcarbamoyladenosine biosynthesis protein TsaE